MARHSHFANIKRQKALTDGVRGKAFTMHARLIAIAARAGGDPDMNSNLRAAIDRAKEDNVPNANIERAIKKGTGEDKEGAAFEEATYEGFGPEGCAILIDTVTDNTNRAFANLRTALTKNGGNIGSSGSVSWKFEKKAFFRVNTGGKTGDDIELELIDAGADDLAEADEAFEVYAPVEQLGKVRKALEDKGFKVEKAELLWKPKDIVMIHDLETARKILALIDVLEADEDVSKVTTNVDFDDSIAAQI
ncbi:YebC/PmpR family DNA-binding transcriptional regulator [Candidatus Peregrinibacteria bacterium]|nr:MAG: YebC/PmpR family DNA-binding transcriptional regulator [Candidatus Peregrinibacteria bacterium]